MEINNFVLNGVEYIKNGERAFRIEEGENGGQVKKRIGNSIFAAALAEYEAQQEAEPVPELGGDLPEESVQTHILRVSGQSNPASVAGALVGVYREQGKVELQTIGAGALNQAVKAVAIARGYAAPEGRNLMCIPAFMNHEMNGEEHTGIRLIIKDMQ